MNRTTPDADRRTKTPPGEPPFSALDEERQASMADEGGVSGALMEVDGESQLRTMSPSRHLFSWKWVVGLVLVGFGVALVARTYPSR